MVGRHQHEAHAVAGRVGEDLLEVPVGGDDVLIRVGGRHDHVEREEVVDQHRAAGQLQTVDVGAHRAVGDEPLRGQQLMMRERAPVHHGLHRIGETAVGRWIDDRPEPCG